MRSGNGHTRRAGSTAGTDQGTPLKASPETAKEARLRRRPIPASTAARPASTGGRRLDAVLCAARQPRPDRASLTAPPKADACLSKPPKGAAVAATAGRAGRGTEDRDRASDNTIGRTQKTSPAASAEAMGTHRSQRRVVAGRRMYWRYQRPRPDVHGAWTRRRSNHTEAWPTGQARAPCAARL